jgi:hypothetical protein
MPWERADSKVGDRHLQRLAAVRVRQSTRQRLLNHQESTRLQYALVDRAITLGWEADRVLVEDAAPGTHSCPHAGSHQFSGTARRWCVSGLGWGCGEPRLLGVDEQLGD